jgi:hypothetical protein
LSPGLWAFWILEPGPSPLKARAKPCLGPGLRGPGRAGLRALSPARHITTAAAAVAADAAVVAAAAAVVVAAGAAGAVAVAAARMRIRLAGPLVRVRPPCVCLLFCLWYLTVKA